MESASRPADEVRIDVPLVRRLVAAQFPQWAGLPVEPAGATGFDNAIFRLGTDLAVRLPRRQFGADHLEREYRWLPVVGPRLPLAVPVPAGKGEPGEGYPWPWMVCSWLPGEIAALAPVADPERAAVTLARFVAALRALDPAGAPSSDLRSGPLAAHDDVIRAAADALRGRLTPPGRWPSGRSPWPPRPGPASRSGCTATCTRPTSWSATARWPPSSTSAWSASAIPPAT